MTIVKLGLIASALLLSGAAFASYAPEGNGHVDIASYAAPEGPANVSRTPATNRRVSPFIRC
jgi:hypothetical protein